MREIIELDDCPDKLREKVSEYLKRSYAELLSVQKFQDTLYKDKSIITTTYKAFTMRGNYFCVFKMSVCSKEEYSDRDVTENSMIAGEIHEIIKLAPDWFNH